MTTPNYGKRLEQSGSDFGAKVALSSLYGTTPVEDHVTINGYKDQDLYGPSIPVFFSVDSDTEKEVAVITAGTLETNRRVRIYTVAYTGSGTPVISLGLTLSFTPTDTPFYYWGVRKIDSTHYVMYYTSTDNSTYFRFRKVALSTSTPVDTLLDEVDITGFDGFGLYPGKFLVTSRIGYVSFRKSYYPDGSTWAYNFKIYVYSIDLSTDIVDGGEVYNAGGTPTNIVSWKDKSGTQELFSLFDNHGFPTWVIIQWKYYFYYIGATQHWTYSVSLVHNTSAGLDTTHTVDGPDGDTQIDGGDYIAGSNWSMQYSSNDFVGYAAELYNGTVPESHPNGYFKCSGSGFVYIEGTLPTESRTVTNTFPSTPYKTSYYHPGFVAIESGTGDYYKIDPQTGFSSTEIVLPEGHSFVSVFPALDTNNGNIYACVYDSIGLVYKILAMDSSDFSIIGTITLNYNFPAKTLNHGNFLFGYTPSGVFPLLVMYLGNVTPPRKSQIMMVLEQN